MDKIVIICPYFGKMPNYFELFLHSCKSNKTIDWIFFTDDLTEYCYPSNVKVNYIKFENFTKIIKEKFNFDIKINKPYKLCDFKPSYGYIFEESIRDYDYWGYCDLDIILGDIRSFVTPELLNKYDKIFCGGHFTLYKNNYENNRYFMKKINGIQQYRKVFTSDENFAFDEWSEGSINRIFIKYNNEPYDGILFADLAPSKSNFKVLHINDNEDIKRKTRYFEWNDGKLISHYYIQNIKYSEDYMYVHFQKRKMNMNFEYKKDILKFYIVPNQFILEEYDFKTIKKYCKEKLIYTQWIKIRLNNLLKKIKKLLIR